MVLRTGSAASQQRVLLGGKKIPSVARLYPQELESVAAARRSCLKASSKQIALWLVLALVLFMIFSVFSKQYRREPEIIFSDFMAAVERGEVREIVIQGHNIQGKYKNGESFRTFEPDDPELVKSLREKQVRIAAKPNDESPWYLLLLNWFPMLLLIGVWIFFMRQMQVGGGKAMSFGK